VVAVVKRGQPVQGRNACAGQVGDRGQVDGEGGVPVDPVMLCSSRGESPERSRSGQGQVGGYPGT
jgi:hypothetical protein